MNSKELAAAVLLDQAGFDVMRTAAYKYHMTYHGEVLCGAQYVTSRTRWGLWRGGEYGDAYKAWLRLSRSLRCMMCDIKMSQAQTKAHEMMEGGGERQVMLTCKRLENYDGPAWYILEDGVVISPPFETERAAWEWSRQRMMEGGERD